MCVVSPNKQCRKCTLTKPKFMCSSSIHKNVEKTYELFDFDNVITNLSINNFKSITGKIKYLLLKHHLFDLLKLYFERKSY